MLQRGTHTNGGDALKKLPIIGLIVGAIAAVFLKTKGSKQEPATEAMEPPIPTEDTSPPA
jgi:hypothetical protein